jgi:putative DNA primase/helicase
MMKMVDRVAEFEKFYDCLMQNAPTDYIPWLFPVDDNKQPDALAVFKRSDKKSSCCSADWIKVKRGKNEIWVCSQCKQGRASWKAPHARLTKEECIKRIKSNENIGFAARANDIATITDLDDESVPDFQKETLSLQSRSRTGRHRIGFAGDTKIKCNIPTEKQGEHRSLDEYIVAPGSFVSLEQKQIDALPEKEKPFAGFYTIEKAVPPAILVYEDLPQCFRDAAEKNPRGEKKTRATFLPGKGTSALFSLKVSDIISNHEARFPHPLHPSDTGANFSFSEDGALGHCWRHLVSLNALQFLAVKSGKFGCAEIGTPHKGAGKTLSDEALYCAWQQAQTDGLIPKDEQPPRRAAEWKKKQDAPQEKEPPLPLTAKELPWRDYNYFRKLKKDKRFIVEGMIPPRTINILYSPPKNYKSYAALDMAICVSQGRDFLQMKTKKFPVAYLDRENNEQELKKRLVGLHTGMGIKRNQNLHLLIQYGDLLDATFVQQLRDYLKEKKIRLLVIDTLHRFADYEENCADDINRIYTKTLQPMAIECDCAILFLHHTTKDGDYRGSSDLLGCVDTAYSIIQTGNRFKLTCRGIRWGTFDSITGEVSFNPDETITFSRVSEKETTEETTQKIKAITAAIRAVFKKPYCELTRKEIISFLKAGDNWETELRCSDKTIDRRLKWLVLNDQLEDLKRGRYKRLWDDAIQQQIGAI